jgi:glycosyltransferase involved in cell wall biosynthesis
VALARGLPVVATKVGGVPEALGHAPDGSRPGLLVVPDDPQALAQALARWLGDPRERARLRVAARSRRLALSDWVQTSRELAVVLSAVPE